MRFGGTPLQHDFIAWFEKQKNRKINQTIIMENTTICPVCKTAFNEQPVNCSNCGFPFSGTEKEKSLFIGQQILKKRTVSDTKDKIKRARIILWIIGGMNLLAPFVAYANSPAQNVFIVAGIILGLIFIGFGFLAYKKPFISILIPLILLVLLHLAAAIADPSTLIKGIVLKVLFIGGLVYGLAGIIESEKIRKESEFMQKQQYK